MSTVIDDAVRTLRTEYYRTVERIAAEIIANGPDDEEQAIHESVDGSEWVIYTMRAHIVALVSDSALEGAEEAEGSGLDSDPLQRVTAWAFSTMRHDVTEAVAAERRRREVPA